jgi:hypothetical protein
MIKFKHETKLPLTWLWFNSAYAIEFGMIASNAIKTVF